MNCKDIQNLSMRYFDGDLDDMEYARLRQHLQNCPGCLSEFEEMNQVMEAIKLNEVEPPQGFEAKVMERVCQLEVIRNRRTKTVLTVLYSLTGLLLLMLGVAFAAGLKDLTVYEAVGQLGSYLNSWSGIMFTLYNILKIFYNMISGITDILLQVVIALTKTYYYIFAAMILMLFILKKMYANLVNG